MDLREQVEQALGAAYTIDGELGGGGMSRVFSATENSLGRRVVIKVLPPEMAEGLSVERFKREIQLAARLQNPHIVPVLTAGEMHGLPYYTMPFVNGHSLRARLTKSGPLSIAEAVSLLKDVARALECAHEAGVVHRDIKPDNVLLSGGSAVVTDFGVAKAVSESKKKGVGETLTHVGTSLGTPAYMAPEQAAADASIDHRADLYSFGVMGYEMLAGQPPFHGRTAQRLLAAQMSERPQPIEELRTDTPPVLAQLIMTCLEKEANDRAQSASEIVRALEQVTSGGGLPAMPAILLGGRRRLWRALALYAVTFVGVAIVARASIIAIGLPNWVFPAAVAVMSLGLPVILATAFVHHGVHRALTATTTTGGSQLQHSTMTKLAVKAGPWVSWRKVAVGGGIAIGSLAFVVLMFMLMRAYGIGPAGSLLASGKLEAKDRLLVADFRATGPDTSLGSVMTEAVRTDLEQSRTVSLVSQSAVSAALKRMQRPDTSRLDVSLARELAQREGMGAVVDGDIHQLGAGYVITLRLLAAESGDALVTYQETIDNTRELLPAIDKVTRKLRAKIGESLKAVRASPRLEEVTTSSLEALKKYDAGLRAMNFDKDNPKAIKLFKEAIAKDTGFAMAYRKLGVALLNEGRPVEESDSAFTRAYVYRDRLPDRERYLTVGSYFQQGPGRDRPRAAAALESLLEIDSTDEIGISNLALIEESRRNFSRAEVLRRRLYALATSPTDSAEALLSLMNSKIDQHNLPEALELLRQEKIAFPHYMANDFTTADMLYSQGYEDSATKKWSEIRTKDSNAQLRAWATWSLGKVARIHGRLNESLRLMDDARQQDSVRVGWANPYLGALIRSWNDMWYREKFTVALAELDSMMLSRPLRSVAFSERPYFDLVGQYAIAGRPDKARVYLNQYRIEEKDSARLLDGEPDLHNALGEIALAEKRPLDALSEFKQEDRRRDGPADACDWCRLIDLGRAYDASGSTDSTIVTYERFLAAPRVANYDEPRAGMEKRLGELYEAKSDFSKAIQHYGAFVALWKDADSDLQPRVAEVRRRIAALEHREPATRP